ncbi:MAG: type III pantothenate kinase [Pirellulaceae bacterium]
MTRLGVAVDVGNFAIKARFFRSQADHAIPLGDPVQVNLQPIDWRECFARWYVEQLNTVAAPDTASIRWRVASVNPPPTRLLKMWVEANLNNPAGSEKTNAKHRPAGTPHHWQEVSFRDVPLKLDIRHPEIIGIDRLIVAWAAWHGRCETTGPSGESNWGFVEKQPQRRRPIIVVDAGSALTVDLVDAEGTFRGGAILPGRQMQLRSLGLGAFALPDLTKRPDTQPPDPAILSSGPECPGRDTQAAIQLGVFAGMVGAIRHLRGAYEQTAGETPELILTGGDASLLAPLFGEEAYWVPSLMLDGLAWL